MTRAQALAVVQRRSDYLRQCAADGEVNAYDLAEIEALDEAAKALAEKKNLNAKRRRQRAFLRKRIDRLQALRVDEPNSIADQYRQQEIGALEFAIETINAHYVTPDVRVALEADHQDIDR